MMEYDVTQSRFKVTRPCDIEILPFSKSVSPLPLKQCEVASDY